MPTTTAGTDFGALFDSVKTPTDGDPISWQSVYTGSYTLINNDVHLNAKLNSVSSSYTVISSSFDRNQTNFFNVLDHGAVGDGVTDDTAALNTLLSSKVTTGSAIYFPGGKTYVISGQLTVTYPRNTLFGGPGAKLLTSGSGGSAHNHIYSEQHYTTVRDLEFENTATATSGSAIAIAMKDNCIIDKCKTTGCYNGAHLYSTEYCRVLHSDFLSCVANGVYVGSSSWTTVDNNRIFSPGMDGFRSGNLNQYVLVTNNLISTPGDDGIALSSVDSHMQICNNIIHDPPDDGIICSGLYNMVANNTINSAGGTAIKLSGVTDARIKDNTLISNANDITDQTLTIASGAVTLEADIPGPIFVDTESAAASDDLDTISGGYEGQMITLRAANTARTVVVKNGTGNISCGADFSMADNRDQITLLRYYNVWMAIAKQDN